MSLRDFNATDDRSAFLQNQPSGNGAGLGNYHTVNPEDSAPSNMPKIAGVLAVALMIGTAGVALYARSTSPSQPQPIAAANNLQAPPAAPAQQAVIAPYANTPAAAPPLPPSAQATKAATADPNSLGSAAVKTHATVKTASTARSHVDSGRGAASARMAADSNQTGQSLQQQAVTPRAASPLSPPSDVATADTQSSDAVPQGAATTSDIAATPQAPAQDQQSAVPAPAQPPAQSAVQVNQ